jgi:hypothetical protein
LPAGQPGWYRRKDATGAFSNNAGFDQHYNHYGRLGRAQAAVDQASLLIVAPNLSNHPVDTGEAIPSVNAIPVENRLKWHFAGD